MRSLIIFITFFLSLSFSAYSNDRSKDILSEFKRISRSGLKPDIGNGQNLRANVDNIKKYGNQKIINRRTYKYWLEIVYIEHASYETALILADIKAEEQFENNTKSFLLDNNEYKKYGNDYLKRVKTSKNKIALLKKNKKKKNSVCIVYAFEFLN